MNQMNQMMQGKLVLDRWATEARQETKNDSQPQCSVGHQVKLLRSVRNLPRQAGQGLSSLGDWLERLGELSEPARADRVG